MEMRGRKKMDRFVRVGKSREHHMMHVQSDRMQHLIKDDLLSSVVLPMETRFVVSFWSMFVHSTSPFRFLKNRNSLKTGLPSYGSKSFLC
jgi:hypothetical protein